MDEVERLLADHNSDLRQPTHQDQAYTPRPSVHTTKPSVYTPGPTVPSLDSQNQNNLNIDIDELARLLADEIIDLWQPIQQTPSYTQPPVYTPRPTTKPQNPTSTHLDMGQGSHSGINTLRSIQRISTFAPEMTCMK